MKYFREQNHQRMMNQFKPLSVSCGWNVNVAPSAM